ncbi:MAG: hypothetical protein V9G12_00920 [Microthrixaceae bacterium]
MPADLLRADLAIEYPFNRTTGPVIGAFYTGLTKQVVVGIKGVDGRVICPPVEYDPTTGEPLTELVKVSDEGTITSWSWVPAPRAAGARRPPRFGAHQARRRRHRDPARRRRLRARGREHRRPRQGPLGRRAQWRRDRHRLLRTRRELSA